MGAGSPRWKVSTVFMPFSLMSEIVPPSFRIVWPACLEAQVANGQGLEQTPVRPASVGS
jgi:hypothetical protein